MPSQTGAGVLGGAMSGAGTGFAIGGPVGAAAGAIIGGAAGYMSGKNADAAKKKANASMNAIPMVDPQQAAHLARVRQLQQHQRAGTDASSAFGAAGIRNVLGTTQANIMRSAGGNAAQGITSLLAAQNGASNAMAGLGAQAGQRADALLGYEGGLIDNMAQRRLALGEFRRNLDIADSVNRDQNINNLVSTGIGLMPSMGLNKKPNFGGGQPSADSQGAMGPAWRNQGSGGILPPSPTQAPQYQMLAGSLQDPTSAYDMGQEVQLY